MKKLTWKIVAVDLELKYDWSISRSSDSKKNNFLLEVTDGEHIGIGEAAPNKRFAEDLDLVPNQFNQMLSLGLEKCEDLMDLKRVLSYPHFFKSLCLGVETCFLDFLAKKNSSDVETLLGLKKFNEVRTSYSIPIIDEEKITDFYLENQLWKFESVKLKVSKTSAVGLLRELSQITQQPLIIDANEGWEKADEFLSFADQVDYKNLLFFEQPLPAHAVKEYQKLKQKSNHPVFADESFLHNPNWNLISDCFDGVNLKIMKVGSLADSIDMLKRAKLLNLKTMIGCMIETSLGISYGMKLAEFADHIDLDGFLHLKDDPSKVLVCDEGTLKRV